MVTFCEPNCPPQGRSMIQIGNVPNTDVFGDSTIILAETLKDSGGCAVQLGRFIPTYINIVDEQLASIEVYYAGKNLSQSRLAFGDNVSKSIHSYSNRGEKRKGGVAGR
jgi:hypothetical protein